MKNEKGTYSKKAILGVALLVVMSASFTFGMIVNDVAYDGVTFEEAARVGVSQINPLNNIRVLGMY